MGKDFFIAEHNESDMLANLRAKDDDRCRVDRDLYRGAQIPEGVFAAHGEKLPHRFRAVSRFLEGESRAQGGKGGRAAHRIR